MTRSAQNVLAGEPRGNDARDQMHRSTWDTVCTPDRPREGPLCHPGKLKQFGAGALVENG